MAITLYELAAADPAIRFSPYCWRTRFALAHKGVAADTRPWHFTDTADLAFSGLETVPVLIDGDTVVGDSWTIAQHLERTRPDADSLFGGTPAHALFVNAWADTILNPGIVGLIVSDIWRALRPQDQGYFRQSRERRLGRPLEAVTEGRDERVLEWRRTLAPVRTVLRRQPWLGGEAPDYADYIVLGSLQWARCISPFKLLADDDSVAEWRDRGFALFGGMAALSPTV